MPRSTGWREGGVLVAAAVAGALLAACASSPGTPGSLPTTTSSSTPSPSSPSPSGTEESAVTEAVDRYFDAMNIAVQTGDVAPFEAATDSSCPCREFANSVAKKFDKGSLVGASVVVDLVEVEIPDDGRAVVAVGYRTSGYQEVAADGSKKSYRPSTVQSSLVLVRSGDGWRVHAENVLERT